MPGLFGKGKSTPVLGLDISSTAVKLLELSRSGGRYRVESYAAGPLPAEAVVENRLNDVSGVAEGIRKAAAQSGTGLRTVAAAVAGSSVITRTIDMPAGLSGDDMETQVALEADQYIPYPLEEVAIDFEEGGPSPRAEGHVEVLLAACRRETIDTRVAAIEAAQLQPEIMDVEVYAVERAFALLRGRLGVAPADTVAVVDVGAATTTLTVLNSGRALYTREQLFGGRQLTDEIMRRYGLPAAEAGLAVNHGGLPDDYEPEVLEPFKQALAQQLARSLRLFFSSSRYNDVDYIVLAGGVAAMPGLRDLARERLDAPVAVANPFADMSIATRVNAAALSAAAPALMTACGLALRSFD